jgi:hypothetical protein
VISVGDIEAEYLECDMFDRLDVAQYGERKEGEEHRERRENDKGYIETAVEFQAGAAATAIGEVLLVISAHLRGNP